jgi:hypothetical protein
MIIPNSSYIVVKVDGDNKNMVPHESFEGTVYSVGATQFSTNPVGGNGQQFTFARLPEAFPLKKGDRVIVGSFVHLTKEHDTTYAICFKDEVYACIKDDEEELNLFNQEMQQETNPQLLKG